MPFERKSNRLKSNNLKGKSKMKKLLFTIFDEKTGLYGNIYTAINLEQAIRDFSYACINDQNSELYRYTKDFHLIQLGEFDDLVGEIELEMVTNRVVLSGLDLIPQKDQ